MRAEKKFKYEYIGWVIFVFSALMYIAAGLKSGDVLSILGGILFLLACAFFLLPIMSLKRARSKTC